MRRRRRRDFERANFISAAGQGDLLDLYNQQMAGNWKPDLQGMVVWDPYNNRLQPWGWGGGADTGGFVDLGTTGPDPTMTTGGGNIIGWALDGTPITLSGDLVFRPDVEGLTLVGQDNAGNAIYRDPATGELVMKGGSSVTVEGGDGETPSTGYPGQGGAGVNYPGGQPPRDDTTFVTNVGEAGGGGGMVLETPPVIPWEPPTEHPNFGQPGGPPPYEGGGWLTDPPVILPPLDLSDPFMTTFETTVFRPEDIEPIKDPITGALTWRPIPSIPIYTPPLGEPPVIPWEGPGTHPGFVSPGGPPSGPTFTWDPPPIEPPPKKTEPPPPKGDGDGGKAQPKKEEPKVQVPIIPIPQQGAPPPGPFAPVVGPQGYQSIFGGPLVSREPQYAPMLNMLLRGIGGR